MVNVRFEKAGVREGRGSLAKYVKALYARLFAELQLEEPSVTVLFCSDDGIRKLNREFLDHDRPTDVLSFPAFDDPKVALDSSGVYLGDLAIALNYTRRQATNAGRRFEEEVALLLVHGLLHLLGWTHDTKAQERRMWKMQDELLALASDITKPTIRMNG